MVKAADAAGGVVVLHGLDEGLFVQPQLARQLLQRVGFLTRKHRRHEAAHSLGVDDRKPALPGLLGHQPAPDGVALGPEVFALVIKALGLLVHHNAQRHAVHARANAAVVKRRARVNRHAVALVGRADGVGALRHQVLEQNAHVEAGAAYGEVVGRPLTGFVLAPGLAQPFAVGLEAAAGHHAGARLNALRAGRAVDVRGDKAAGVKFEPLDFSLITHLDAELLSAAVVSVHQRLAAAHEERIGARQMQRARQRRLKAHAVLAHPAAAA